MRKNDKDFKRLVRRRMEQTGESYSIARMRLLAINANLPGRAVHALRGNGLKTFCGIGIETRPRHGEDVDCARCLAFTRYDPHEVQYIAAGEPVKGGFICGDCGESMPMHAPDCRAGDDP